MSDNLKFYLMPSFKYAEPLANKADIDLFNSLGIEGIKKLGKCDKEVHSIIQRLVNTYVIPEGRH